VGEARGTGRQLTERALKMHCAAYLADVKARLLTAVIFELKTSKDSLAIGLSKEQSARANLDALVSRRTEELERVRSRLEAEERERARLQSRLIQTERMHAIGALASSVAHDLRNYLMVVSCCLDELPATASVLIADAQEATAQALRLTAQLMDLGRRPMPKLRSAAVNAVVARTVALLAPSLPGQVEVRLALDPGEPRALLDPDEVQRALLNLCLNARDAVAERGGFITLATGTQRIAEPPPYAPESAAAGEYVWLRVSDNGAGIPADQLRQVFEPFFTTKEPGKGTGLGLSQVYGCARAHDGWVEVQSTEGVGSSFQIFLPSPPPPPG
jgi:signal transduction histidine kinase